MTSSNASSPSKYVLISSRPGWTRAAEVRFLGEPDLRSPNPHHPNGARLRLYLASRVIEVESSSAWKEWLAESFMRREAARQSHAARAALALIGFTAKIQALDRAGALAPTRLPIERVVEETGEFLRLRGAKDLTVRARRLVGHLRHQHTKFDALARMHGLAPDAGAAWQRRAYNELLALQDAAILREYPEIAAMLAEEKRVRASQRRSHSKPQATRAVESRLSTSSPAPQRPPFGCGRDGRARLPDVTHVKNKALDSNQSLRGTRATRRPR